MKSVNRTTVTKAAKAVDVSRQTILQHIKLGKLVAKKRLNSYLIQLTDLRKWAEANGLDIDESLL